MKPPLIRRFRASASHRRGELGVTMVLVAVAMIAIIAMAAWSIDLVTLYLAREEAQRSADSAALAAARIISISGLTGDPDNITPSWQSVCQGLSSPASQAAQAVATQSAISSVSGTVDVKYSAGGQGPSADCSTLPAAFGVNPMVTVQVTRAGLPTFFSVIWGATGNTVSATATAEVFNPSNSGNVGNFTTGSIIPVQPRCVKPWIVANKDPLYPNVNGDGAYCDDVDQVTSTITPCNPLVNTADGSIAHKGISLNGTSANGVIGERFTLEPDCRYAPSNCQFRNGAPPRGNYPVGFHTPSGPPNLQYLPGQTLNNSVAVPGSVSAASLFEQAIAGCDQTTVYQCGVPSSSASSPNQVDLSENPDGSGDTTNGVTALIHEGDSDAAQPTGQDTLSPYGAPSAYPFQILSGSGNPIIGPGLAAGTPITASNSIVSLPIYDSANNVVPNDGGVHPVTIVGFLQVFINAVDQWGNVDITVLNVAGCGNGTSTTSSIAINGSSPVPVRLITPP
jgi:Flp pilus assembly protein TadG